MSELKSKAIDVLEYKIPWQYPAPVLDIETPLLATHSVDDGPFVEFPTRGLTVLKRNGYNEVVLLDHRTYDEYTDLLQSWLFFNLVQEVLSALHVIVSMSDFTTTSCNDSKVITAQRCVNDLDSTLKRRRGGWIRPSRLPSRILLMEKNCSKLC